MTARSSSWDCPCGRITVRIGLALHRDTIRLLREIIQTSGKIYMIAGSGSTANEVALNSALRPGEKVIVGNNGMFGDRLIEMIASLLCEPIEVKSDPGVPLSAAAFADALARHPDATLVAAVQLETSTGVLNPVREIASVANAAGVRVMVDAVSSLAGTDLPMDQWKIDLVTSGSQKCLGGPPGLAVVAVGDEGWKLVERPGARGWIMNLNLWQKYAVDWGDWHPHPATMPDQRRGCVAPVPRGTVTRRDCRPAWHVTGEPPGGCGPVCERWACRRW